MGDLNVRLIAEKLGKDLESAADAVTQELQTAIKDLAQAAYANVIAHAQASNMSDENKKNYLSGIQFMDIGNDSYIIYLDGVWPTKLEEGFEAYSIKDVLLQSSKTVAVGKRAGEPWVRENKQGKKYAAVPFEHRPSASASGDLGADLKKLYAYNRQGKKQKITKTFTDDLGKPITGKVAKVSGELNPELPPNLEGLTKYQSVSEKGRVSNVYMTYRMVSEDSTGWQHPGHPGYGFFEKVEREVEQELENIIQRLL